MPASLGDRRPRSARTPRSFVVLNSAINFLQDALRNQAQFTSAECSHYAEMTMSQKKAAGSSELRIRCDEALHRQLAEAAKRSLRSMTREVIFRRIVSSKAVKPELSNAL
jgi:predicted HicB family RNase H-like nuclease